MRWPKPGISVIVAWYDAAIDPGFEGKLSEVADEDLEGQVVFSWGLLLQVGKRNLVLASDASGIRERTYRTLTRIPKDLILAIWGGQPGPLVFSTARGASVLKQLGGAPSSGSK